MATFTSERIPVDISAERLFDSLSNLETLKTFLANVPADRIPADKRDLYEKINVTSDTISFPAGPVGEVTLRLADCVRPSDISLVGVGTPVALSMSLHIEPEGAGRCACRVAIDIAIPMMLKPMVAGPIQNAVDQTARLLPTIAAQISKN